MSVIAQSNSDKETNHEEVAMRMTKEMHNVIGLDSIQFQAIYLINLSDITTSYNDSQKHRERAEKARMDGVRIDNPRITAEERMIRLYEIEERRALRNESMRQILSPEQYEKYLEFESDKRRVRTGRRIRNR